LAYLRASIAEKAALDGVDKYLVGGSNSKAGTPAPELPEANGSTSRAQSTPPPATNGEDDELASTSVLREDGSEVDELASDNDTSMTSAAPDASGSAKSGSRQAALRDKALQKQTQAAIKVKDAAKSKNVKNTPIKTDIPDRQRIQEGLEAVEGRDRLVDREFRRHRDVLRIRPLGKDRFFNRYWYFDGIGTMELISSEDGSVVYGTGRLFVQGPSKEDQDFAVTLGSDSGLPGLEARRKYEEGEESVLAIDEWAYIEDDEQVRANEARSILIDLRPGQYLAQLPQRQGQPRAQPEAGHYGRPRIHPSWLHQAKARLGPDSCSRAHRGGSQGQGPSRQAFSTSQGRSTRGFIHDLDQRIR
jgi:bromodomain adjacent to zinc finger domain protein 1A